MIKYYSINGQIVLREKAVLSIEDIAILRGYGLFDYFLVKNDQALFLEDHLDRFWQSADIMHLQIPMSREALVAAIHEVVRANGMSEASIRVVLTGGVSENGYAPAPKQNLLILQHESPTYPEEEYEQGMKLMLHEFMRTLPGAKSTDYAMGVQLLPRIQAAGAKGVLYHWNGVIHEMAKANFYIVKQDGTIVTTSDEILHGITRKKVLEIAKQNYQVEERNISLEELQTAKEAFMSNTTRRVMSVVKIDDLTVGNGKPGPVATDLRQRLFKIEEEYIRQAGK